MNLPVEESYKDTVAGLTDAEMQKIKIIDQVNSVIVVYKPGQTSKSQKERKSEKEQISKVKTVSPTRTEYEQPRSSLSRDPKYQKKHNRKKSASEPTIPTQTTDTKSQKRHTKSASENSIHAQMSGNEQTSLRMELTNHYEASDGPPSLDLEDLEQASSSRHPASQRSPALEQSHSPTKEDHKGDNVSALCCCRMNYRIRSFVKELIRFRALKIGQLILAIYICVLTFADMGPPGGLRDTGTGLIIDQASPTRTERGVILLNGTERAIVGETQFQVACIGIARLTAWFMYPALVFVFISKFRATTSFISKSPLAMYMYSDSHELHIYCGWMILVCSLIHATFHIARWAQQGNLHLLVDHFSGLTGLIIILSCLLICIPMTIFRGRIGYEIRKSLHYLFILFAGALVFHTPTSAIPNGGFTAYVFGTLLVWYFLDASYSYFFMTEKIDTTKFSVLSSGVRMTMNVSERFQKMGSQGGICYVCLPWVAKDQWHAFSLFEDPSNPAERQIFIQKTGDWTTKLHRILQRDTVRPAWVHGPFPSPYENADAYDNQILVASGIGITPALSVIKAHKDSRRINLIWAVRDQALLEFFLHHLYLDHQGWNLIFYTGKKKLRGSYMDIRTNTNICIIEGRPKLNEVIPNIIYGIESGLGMPENYTPGTREIASEMLADRLASSNSSGMDDMAEELACYATELGFHLQTDTISQEFDLFQSSDLTLPGRRRASQQSIMEHLAIGFCPWDHYEGAKKYVKNLDKKLILPTWGMLYCGGAKQVLSELEKISDEHQIGLHVESFAW